jgi:hypothetical protein
MGRSASLHMKLANALPELFPDTWGRRKVPTTDKSFGAYIDDLNALGLDQIPRYVDAADTLLLDSPFELKARKRTYNDTVSLAFRDFWARVEEHAAKRRKQTDPVKQAVHTVQRVIDALAPEQRKTVLDALLLNYVAHARPSAS